MKEKLTSTLSGTMRDDLLRAVALVLITGLLWCACYDRWTTESWQTPVTYLGDPEKIDVLLMLSWGKAAADGHISPISFNYVPELGAPNIANWNDFPLPEKPLFWTMGLLSHFIGLFAAANVVLLLAQVLAVLAFYATARLLRSSWPWAAAGGIAFGFSTYEFAHGLHHITVTMAWHIPFDILVWEWLFRGQLELRGRNFILALLVAVATALQNIYYTCLFLEFVALAGLYQAWRGGWRRALPALAVLGATVVADLAINFNTILYGLVNGAGGAVVRPYRWLEVYGLKLVDLVVPPPNHPFSPFAEWGEHHLHEVLLPPGELPPTAYLGLLGLAALTWLVVVSVRRAVQPAGLPLETYQILWILIYGGVGGINCLLGTFGFDLLRATTRYSIVVLAIVLLFAVRRLSAFRFSGWTWGPYVLASLAALLALWDQTPPYVSDADISQIAAEVNSDRQFTAQMEQRLGDDAMIFQLPAMEFPESPVPGVSAFDHLRPYLYAHHLRFSFGNDKGRPTADLQMAVGNLPPEAMITQLVADGFAAIYVNRHGYQDGGAALLQVLRSMGYSELIENDQRDLVCVPLTKK